MENKKDIIKNILFKIALLPYIIIIIMCIYYAIVGYEPYGKVYYGFYAIEEYLGDVVFNYLVGSLIDFPINLIAIPIIIMWIGYQIYYFITFKKGTYSENNDIYREYKMIYRKNKVRKIIFYLCIACWCLYLASGIFAFFSSGDVREIIYAYLLYGVIFSYIPVLPISLLYIIIYIIVNKRKKKIIENVK